MAGAHSVYGSVIVPQPENILEPWEGWRALLQLHKTLYIGDWEENMDVRDDRNREELEMQFNQIVSFTLTVRMGVTATSWGHRVMPWLQFHCWLSEFQNLISRK
jgi:hypothetical protein